MNSDIRDVIRESEYRYLSKDEEQKVLAYTTGLPARFAVARNVEAREDAIVRHVIDTMKKKYPRFDKLHGSAWEKGYRDVQLVLRNAVNAMVWQDSMVQEEILLHWFGTIVMSFGMTPAFMTDTYVALKEGAKAHLSPEAYTGMESYLQKIVDILGKIPEPAVALV
jgi:hypothetical protein